MMENSFFQKTKSILLIFFVIAIVCMAIFSVYRVIAYSSQTVQSHQFDQKEETNQPAKNFFSKPYFSKGNFILPLENFSPTKEQNALEKGETYAVLQMIKNDSNETFSCFFDQMQVVSLNANHIVLKGMLKSTQSHLEQYALWHSKQIEYQLLSLSEYQQKKVIQSCRTWIHVQESGSEIRSDKQYDVVNLKLGKCTALSNHVIEVAGYPLNSIQIQQHPITFKKQLCHKTQSKTWLTLFFDSFEKKQILITSDPSHQKKKSEVSFLQSGW